MRPTEFCRPCLPRRHTIESSLNINPHRAVGTIKLPVLAKQSNTLQCNGSAKLFCKEQCIEARVLYICRTTNQSSGNDHVHIENSPYIYPGKSHALFLLAGLSSRQNNQILFYFV